MIQHRLWQSYYQFQSCFCNSIFDVSFTSYSSGLELEMNHISQNTRFLFKIFISSHQKRQQIKLILNVPFYVGWKYFLTSEALIGDVIVFGCSHYTRVTIAVEFNRWVRPTCSIRISHGPIIYYRTSKGFWGSQSIFFLNGIELLVYLGEFLCIKGVMLLPNHTWITENIFEKFEMWGSLLSSGMLMLKLNMNLVKRSYFLLK